MSEQEKCVPNVMPEKESSEEDKLPPVVFDFGDEEDPSDSFEQPLESDDTSSHVDEVQTESNVEDEVVSSVKDECQDPENSVINGDPLTSEQEFAASEGKKGIESSDDKQESDSNPPIIDKHTQQDSVSLTQVQAENLISVEKNINEILHNEEKLFDEVRAMHKLYHKEFEDRLRSMQSELDRYHDIDRGRVYDGILSALARIYCNYETIVDEIEDPKLKKNMRYLFLDLEDIMKEFGMDKIRSEPGARRNTKHCQVKQRIATDDSDKHDTIIKSYNSGFGIGNRNVIKEVVDIFFYEPVADEQAKPECANETAVLADDVEEKEN